MEFGVYTARRKIFRPAINICLTRTYLPCKIGSVKMQGENETCIPLLHIPSFLPVLQQWGGDMSQTLHEAGGEIVRCPLKSELTEPTPAPGGISGQYAHSMMPSHPVGWRVGSLPIVRSTVREDAYAFRACWHRGMPRKGHTAEWSSGSSRGS